MKGIISAGHELTAQAGLEMFSMGGNAFDAALAAVFASFVAEPALTSLGGGGFLMAHSREGENILYDFFTSMAGLGRSDRSGMRFFPGYAHFTDEAQEFHIGEGAAAVPGCVAGIQTVYERHCTLPVRKIISPAIHHARGGVIVNSYQAYFFKVLTPILTASAGARHIFAPKGVILKEGDKIYNHDMADTLEYLADKGLQVFYNGEIAEKMLESFGSRGLITREDLSNYRVEIRKPLIINYRGREIYTNPPPSSGGSLTAFSIKLLEKFNLMEIGHNTDEYLMLLMEAMKITGEARKEKFDDMVHDEGLGRLFVSSENIQAYIKRLMDNINPLSSYVETSSGNTTHISVIDCEGNAVSVTTSNGVSCGFTIPDMGILMNNMMGEEDLNPHGFHARPAGRRISSMMSPTIVMRDGSPEIVLGSGGSKRIRSAILQVILNMIDFGIPVCEAVNLPRVHWDGAALQVESGLDNKMIENLEKKGIPVKKWGRRDVYFGGVHSVGMSGIDGTMSGGGDERRGGVTLMNPLL